jgi:hypothetical protein
VLDLVALVPVRSLTDIGTRVAKFIRDTRREASVEVPPTQAYDAIDAGQRQELRKELVEILRLDGIESIGGQYMCEFAMRVEILDLANASPLIRPRIGTVQGSELAAIVGQQFQDRSDLSTESLQHAP